MPCQIYSEGSYDTCIIIIENKARRKKKASGAYVDMEGLDHPAQYSRLSLSRIPRDFLKYFEISVLDISVFQNRGKTNSITHIEQIYV